MKISTAGHSRLLNTFVDKLFDNQFTVSNKHDSLFYDENLRLIRYYYFVAAICLLLQDNQKNICEFIEISAAMN